MPQLAAGDQILAIPTLVRAIPKPARKIIGDLSNIETGLAGYEQAMFPRSAEAAADDILELCLDANTPLGLIDLLTGHEQRV